MISAGEVSNGAEFGRLLSAAARYEVRRVDGERIGVLDHVRYQQHGDRPDELIVRRGRFGLRRVSIPFEAVQAVKPKERAIVVSLEP